jgi:hypothetical protein
MHEDGDFDLLLIDCMMPDISDVQSAEQAGAARVTADPAGKLLRRVRRLICRARPQLRKPGSLSVLAIALADLDPISGQFAGSGTP